MAKNKIFLLIFMSLILSVSSFAAVPTVSNLSFSSTSGSDLTNDNLTLTFDVTDADSDPVTNITEWVKNGKRIHLLNIPFEAYPGDTIVTDYAGNSVPTPSGTFSFINGGIRGRAADFDGLNGLGYVSGSMPNLSLAQDFSLSYFVNPGVPNSGHVFETGSTVNNGVITSNVFFGFARCSFYNDPFVSTVSTSSTINGTGWRHITCSWDSSTRTMSLYLDGVFQQSNTASSAINSSSVNFMIGRQAPGSNYFNGSIDELILWNETITAETAVLLSNRLTNIIPYSETQIGDNFSMCVVPNDGVSDGANYCSGIIRIKNLPVLDSISVEADFNQVSFRWDTDTITNGTIYYGTTESLSDGFVSDENFINYTRYRLARGLSSDTFYYYNLTYCTSLDECNVESGNFTTETTFNRDPFLYNRNLCLNNSGIHDWSENFTGYQIIDTTNLNKFQPNGDDIVITDNSSGQDVEIHRRVYQSNTTNTFVYWKTGREIQNGTEDCNYNMYYGNSTFDTPKETGMKVFLWFDDFEIYNDYTSGVKLPTFSDWKFTGTCVACGQFYVSQITPSYSFGETTNVGVMSGGGGQWGYAYHDMNEYSRDGNYTYGGYFRRQPGDNRIIATIRGETNTWNGAKYLAGINSGTNYYFSSMAPSATFGSATIADTSNNWMFKQVGAFEDDGYDIWFNSTGDGSRLINSSVTGIASPHTASPWSVGMLEFGSGNMDDVFIREYYGGYGDEDLQYIQGAEKGPAQAIIDSPSDWTYTNNVTVNFTWNVTGDAYNITLTLLNSTSDVAKQTTFTSPPWFSQAYNLIDDDYTWFITIFGTNTQKFTSASSNLIIDTTPPIIILNSPGTAGFFRNSTVNFNWTIIEPKFNNMTFNIYNSTGIYLSSFTMMKMEAGQLILPNEVYRWNVTVHDKAGNVASSETWYFVVDTNAPVYRDTVVSKVLGMVFIIFNESFFKAGFVFIMIMLLAFGLETAGIDVRGYFRK